MSIAQQKAATQQKEKSAEASGEMTKWQEYRQKHPEFSKVSDEDLFNYLHLTYYSDIPKAKLAELIGYQTPQPAATPNAFTSEHYLSAAILMALVVLLTFVWFRFRFSQSGSLATKSTHDTAESMQSVPTSSGVNFCPHCGVKITDMGNFCTQCGGTLSGQIQSVTDATTTPFVFGFLRIVRGLCGLIFGIQVVGLLPVLTWIQQPSAATGGMLAHVFIKIIVLVIFGGLFFVLRNLINRLHNKKYGTPHPVLVKKWAL